MPRNSRRIYSTYRISVVRVIGAPAAYVYDWCTDYRSDDWRVAKAGTHPRFRVLRLSPHRVLRIRRTPNGRADPDTAIDLVRLEPPHRWHTDQIDEEELETVDYRVVPLGRRRTRLEVTMTDRWMVPRHLSRSETRRRITGAWERYATFIEDQYRAGRPARG